MGNRSGNKDEEEGGGGGWNREVKRERMSGSESEQGRDGGNIKKKEKLRPVGHMLEKNNHFIPHSNSITDIWPLSGDWCGNAT